MGKRIMIFLMAVSFVVMNACTPKQKTEASQDEEQPAMTEASFKVWGNCDMCKERIEKAAMSVSGVGKAAWDQSDMMLKISYDESKANPDEVHKAIAMAGHKTDMMEADMDAYNALPKCCMYTKPEGKK